MRELEELLKLSQITRIEAFDISNTSGIESVGSMVVYENGKPKRSDYRKFKIKWVKGPNDYASMEEVLTRRFCHGIRENQGRENIQDSFRRFPDLIMMDGGKGQVHVAQKVLESMNLTIPVCGMVKDDSHRTKRTVLRLNIIVLCAGKVKYILCWMRSRGSVRQGENP